MPVKIIISKPVYMRKLLTELAAAGFLRTSSREGEFITVEDSDNTAAVMTVYDAHDPAPTAAETRAANARTEAALSGAIKTMTAQQAVDYIETNVTNIATAKAVLKLMARMLVALRDETWPDMVDK